VWSLLDARIAGFAIRGAAALRLTITQALRVGALAPTAPAGNAHGLDGDVFGSAARRTNDLPGTAVPLTAPMILAPPRAGAMVPGSPGATGWGAP
jgi:hypothetical protein